MQCTNTVLMVRPVKFAFNEQTAVNNVFQEQSKDEDVNAIAQKEFDNYVQMLKDAGINVIVVDDTPTPHTPDSIFPNNWFSTHKEVELYGENAENPNGTVLILYPMNAPNRREERKKNVLKALLEHPGLHITKKIDFTEAEQDNKFLEGTGSIILDRDNKIAYCCRSARSDEDLLKLWASKTGYKYIMFNATDENNFPIYHTNVMMCVGRKYVFICLDAVKDANEKNLLLEMFERTNKEIVEISFEQVRKFAGNMLVLKNNNGNLVLIMSATAKASLSEEQLKPLLSHYEYIVAPKLECIETNGGGSARCMIAEVF